MSAIPVRSVHFAPAVRNRDDDRDNVCDRETKDGNGHEGVECRGIPQVDEAEQGFDCEGEESRIEWVVSCGIDALEEGTAGECVVAR